MQKELYERVRILEDNGIISRKVACYSYEAADFMLSQVPRASQEKLEMFITHLAMAGKRAEEGTKENPIDKAVLEAVEKETVYQLAVTIRDSLLSMTDIAFPETERNFLSVHLCNLLL